MLSTIMLDRIVCNINSLLVVTIQLNCFFPFNVRIIKNNLQPKKLTYCTHVWGNLVTWQNKKQFVIARSSAKAELRVMTYGICEGMWLKRLLNELSIPVEYSMKMFCNNQATINIAKNSVHHDWTKHVEINCHFIKEKIEKGTISLVYTPTIFQTTDVFSKTLSRSNFEDLRSKLKTTFTTQLEGECGNLEGIAMHIVVPHNCTAYSLLF